MDDLKFPNAPAGDPTSISNRTSGAQPISPAGATTWYDRFFIVHRKHDPATHALVGQDANEITEEMFSRILAMFAELPAERVLSLDRDRQRRLFGLLAEGASGDVALQCIEAELRVH